MDELSTVSGIPLRPPAASIPRVAARRGFMCLFLSVALNAGGLHANRLAVADATPLMVAFLSLLWAVASFFALGWAWRRAGWRALELHSARPGALVAFMRGKFRILLPTALLLALGSWLVTVSLKQYGPAMTAFLMNLTLFMLVIAGHALGERLRPREWVAILLMLCGALVFSYHGGRTAWGALAIMGIACAITAGKQLLVKSISATAPLPVVMCAILFLSMFWTLAAMLATGAAVWPTRATLLFPAVGGLLCNVLGMSLLYRAYQLIGVARGAPFDALRPLAVLALGVPLGYDLPSPAQAVGALMILTGSAALCRWHSTQIQAGR